jgi:hypothetical protein
MISSVAGTLEKGKYQVVNPLKALQVKRDLLGARFL